MDSDHEANKDAEQHSTDRWYNHRPSGLTKAIAAIFIYSLFILIDVHDIWPWSRIAAIAVGVLATIALLYLEALGTNAISFLSFLIGSVVIAFAGLVVYREVPLPSPIPPDVGWLQPGNEPTPPNNCSMGQISGNSLVAFLGGTAVIGQNHSYFVALRLGDCGLTLESGPNGLSVSVPIFDRSGASLGTLVRNKYEISKGKGVVVERSGDLTTLVVHDAQGEELLYVRYLNRNTVRIRGTISCPTPRLQTIEITDESLKGGGDTFFGGCMGNQDPHGGGMAFE